MLFLSSTFMCKRFYEEHLLRSFVHCNLLFFRRFFSSPSLLVLVYLISSCHCDNFCYYFLLSFWIPRKMCFFLSTMLSHSFCFSLFRHHVCALFILTVTYVIYTQRRQKQQAPFICRWYMWLCVILFAFLNCFSRVSAILSHFLWALHAILMKFHAQYMGSIVKMPSPNVNALFIFLNEWHRHYKTLQKE